MTNETRATLDDVVAAIDNLQATIALALQPVSMNAFLDAVDKLAAMDGTSALDTLSELVLVNAALNTIVRAIDHERVADLAIAASAGTIASTITSTSASR